MRNNPVVMRLLIMMLALFIFHAELQDEPLLPKVLNEGLELYSSSDMKSVVECLGKALVL